MLVTTRCPVRGKEVADNRARAFPAGEPVREVSEGEVKYAEPERAEHGSPAAHARRSLAAKDGTDCRPDEITVAAQLGG